MRLNEKQISRLVTYIFAELKSQNLVEFKEKEDKVFNRSVELIVKDYQREAQLDLEVERMMDDLERKNPGEFQRYKMFPLLKKRLAKEKGIVL